MKGNITIVLAVLLIAGNNAGAQIIRNPEAAAYLREDLTRAGVNSNCYEFPELKDTPAPKGYKPFYISHYGRHGSRSDWGSANYARLEKVLSEGKAAGILTPGGDSLLTLTREVIRLHDGMDGRLVPRGLYEHRMLADRMFHRYRRVFTKGSGKISAVSSMVPRCMLSMTAFTDRLSELDPGLDIHWDAGEKIQAYVDNVCPSDIDKSAYRIIDSLYAAEVPDTVLIFRRLFTDAEAGRRIAGDPVQFQRDIFAAGRVQDPFELDGNIMAFLPFDVVYHNWEYVNINHFLHQCNSEEFGDRRLPAVRNLVDDIVSRADDAIRTGNHAADLRFGHDYPALNLVCYLGFEGVGERYDVEAARQHFNGSLYFPFAMSIQMVFYRNNSGDILVKFLLNEQETLLRGLAPVSGPYYRWNTVKANLKGYLQRSSHA